MTLTLYKSNAQFPVSTSEKQPPGDSERARRSNRAQGANAPQDGPAEVSVCLNAHRHNGVARGHMSLERTQLAPAGSHVSGKRRKRRLSSVGESVGHAARWDNGMGEGSRQCWLVPPTGSRCNTSGSVTGLSMHRDAPGRLLPVIMPAGVAPAQAIETHCGMDVAALDVTTAKAGGCLGMWVGASVAEAEGATVDEAAIREAEIPGDRDGPGTPRCASTGD
jgi:hypothetical protein